jgi:hypothetical protein
MSCRLGILANIARFATAAVRSANDPIRPPPLGQMARRWQNIPPVAD